MNIGALDRRVTLLKRSLARRDSGELVESWAPLATVWASRRDAKGGEVEQAEREIAVDRTTFLIRFRADVGAPDRVRDPDGDWQITNTGQVGRRAGLALTCELVGA